MGWHDADARDDRQRSRYPRTRLAPGQGPEVLPELAAGGKLSPLAVKTRGDGMHGDGRNLWLQVTGAGRSWVFRYRFSGKQRLSGCV